MINYVGDGLPLKSCSSSTQQLALPWFNPEAQRPCCSRSHSRCGITRPSLHTVPTCDHDSRGAAN